MSVIVVFYWRYKSGFSDTTMSQKGYGYEKYETEI